ncbi:putative ATP-dependent RNA helicase TDRD9 [Armadillidium vulgare]|nr:putative ATP-dependent RNA helicase TDRD9 [Armadillidium vulgare]
MMSKHTSFKGKAEDYLDWFTIGYAKANKIVLPSNTLQVPEIDLVKTEAPVYQRQDLGSSYSQDYVNKHNKEYMNVFAHSSKLQIKSTKVERERHLEDISTIADSEYDEFKNCIEAEGNFTYVYYQYNFSKYDELAEKLPVSNWKKEILEKIENYPVIVIEGSTGCGKSTQVPQFILDDGYRKHKHVNILVTQPRKIAAISLAKRVCQERQWALGSLVGYKVGLQNKTSVDTRIAYVTTEVLVQKAINKKTLEDYTHIILDEIHERDQHTDIALLIVKKLLHSVSKNVKVILMSATIDCQKFAEYFAVPIGGHLIPAPVVAITDKCTYTLQTYYLDHLLNIASPVNQAALIKPESPGISTEMFRLSVNLIECLDDLEREKENLKYPNFPNNRGAVLMFLPGLYEIETITELLRQEAKQRQWEIFPLHSSFTVDEQNLVFRKLCNGFRKIIVSTNIAESSITVSDIKYVIDFCLTKELNTDPITNYTSLKMVWASKASCTQRAGRAGRVASGRVYRLVKESFYKELNPHTTPELSRTPLSQVILKLKLLDMGAPISLLALALDPPNIADIHRTILVLKQLGALALKTGDKISTLDGDLTFLGHVAAALPLDLQLSKLIVLGYIFGCLKETVIIAAGLSLKNFHSTPFQDELNAFLSKIWERFHITGSFHGNPMKEKEWAQSSYIQLDALKEVDKLVKELNQRLRNLKVIKHLDVPPLKSTAQPFFLKICIAGAFYPNYFKRSVFDDYEKSICKELSGFNPFSTIVVSGLPSDTNFLYHDQLTEIFKDCSKEVKISYEGSRAYIQFPSKKSVGKEKSNDIPGEFPTAMYLALKFKQVPRYRSKIAISLLSPDESQERLNAVLSKGSDYTKFHESNKRTVQQHDFEFKPPVMPHPKVHAWQVMITHIENPSRFWGISNESERVQEESFIRSIIDLSLQDESLSSPLRKIYPQMGCLAPYFDQKDNQELYYRAKIEEICESRENTTKVLIYSVVHNVIRLKLYEESQKFSDDQKKSINQILIENGYAVKSEEFFMSKQNHKLRTIYGSGVHSTSAKLLLSSTTCLSQSSLNVSRLESNYSGSCRNRKGLNGPYSPLEMKFIALTRKGFAKGVLIDNSSVNSTALDLEPQNPYDRLIVASQVVLNPTESKIVLRNTTLMPALPGMLPLCLLIFSPFVELRVNEDGWQYIGALCGLGSNPDNGEPIYPEDDIEVPFDFNFTDEDLSKINVLRYLMSCILKRSEEGNPENLLKTQEFLRNLILEIMSETRHYVTLETFSKSHKWNQVPKNKIIRPNINDPDGENFIWPQHNGIKLEDQSKRMNLQANLKYLRKLERRLKDEKQLGSFSIDETCLHCEEYLTTFDELQTHLTQKSHMRKEHEFYGLL